MGCKEGKGVHNDVEVADHPVGWLEGGIEVVQDPIEMTLQRPAELKEVPFCDVSIRTACGLAKSDTVERENGSIAKCLAKYETCFVPNLRV